MPTEHIFQPDFTLSPGEHLEELLETRGISGREFARRCGRSPKLISEILAGKAPVEPATALQFEKVLTDISATVWTNLEAGYRLQLARVSEDRQLAEGVAWAQQFPLKDLQEFGCIPHTKNKTELVKALLQFFGVASIAAYEENCRSVAVSYRHSPSFSSKRHSLFAWLRIGELKADTIKTNDYDRAAFLKALSKIRTFTLNPVDDFIPAITAACAEAGVAFLVVRPMSGIALSGVSRWLHARKALIQQSMRHMSNDHFWFTFFHEAAHLLLHSRKTVFVDGRNLDTVRSQEEIEADKWATEFLIPGALLSEFISFGDFAEDAVRRFARDVGVAPGIVVGQMQNRGGVGYNHPLNHLKEKYQWVW